VSIPLHADKTTWEKTVGKIVISTNMSLDGVVQDPDGREGAKAGGWFNEAGGNDLEAWTRVLLDEALTAEALLLGRRSDHWFASRWPSRTTELADRLNSLPKYVVSSTLDKAEWSNATVLAGDVIEQVTKLRQELAGDVLVYASYQLGRALIEHDLVDELRLFVFPALAGTGERLFGETSGRKPLRLTDARTVGEALTYLTYQIVRDI
jgi:dihydrofolate reductase